MGRNVGIIKIGADQGGDDGHTVTQRVAVHPEFPGGSLPLTLMTKVAGGGRHKVGARITSEGLGPPCGALVERTIPHRKLA